MVKEMKCTNINGKFIFIYSITEQDCIRDSIRLSKKDIEMMEQKIKDLDFAVYLRAGKFPE